MANGAEFTVNPLQVAVTIGSATGLTSPERIEADDPRLRLLGGRWGITLPEVFEIQAVVGGAGERRYGLVGGVEFALPPGATEFEMVTLDSGAPNPRLFVEVNGAVTNSNGYDLQTRGTGALTFVRVSLPSSSAQRTIRLLFADKPLFGLNLPQGAVLPALPSGQRPSIVFEGDSITEGSIASHPWLAWPALTARRLGISNPIVVGIGATGYLARASASRFNFRQRVDNVTKAVNGGPPDAVVVAGGVNDCSVAEPSPFPIPDVGAEALRYFQELRAQAPNMVIFVLGPWTGYGLPSYSNHLRSCRDAIFDAATQVPGVFTVDVSDWVTPANRDQVFDASRDTIHPVDGGHAIYAMRASAALRAIIEGF